MKSSTDASSVVEGGHGGSRRPPRRSSLITPAHPPSSLPATANPLTPNERAQATRTAPLLAQWTAATDRRRSEGRVAVGRLVRASTIFDGVLLDDQSIWEERLVVFK
jgi:hypothetical protein